MSGGETIFALSSGQPPAAVALVRISGRDAGAAIIALAGRLPVARRATLAKLHDPDTGEALDEALVLWFPGPASATGEDLAELHCHGGRAVVRAVEVALATLPGLRRAEPGEFTRRAFANGRIDLAEAEGLSDLLFAETELQRKAALRAAGGALSQRIETWRAGVLRLSALVEAELDFSDEDDVEANPAAVLCNDISLLTEDIGRVLARPRTEKLRDGIRVVLGGPPNSGKSTLLNALVEREAAIVSSIAGTTRDVIEVPVALGGFPFVFVDTAGVRDEAGEEIEAIGIERARAQFAEADLVLWLGREGEGPRSETTIEIASRADARDFVAKGTGSLTVSAKSGEGMAALVDHLLERSRDLLPSPDQLSVNERQAALLAEAVAALGSMPGESDLLIVAEHLRQARRALDAITGLAGTEDMLDTLFGKFCIGK